MTAFDKGKGRRILCKYSFGFFCSLFIFYRFFTFHCFTIRLIDYDLLVLYKMGQIFHRYPGQIKLHLIKRFLQQRWLASTKTYKYVLSLKKRVIGYSFSPYTKKCTQGQIAKLCVRVKVYL